MTKKKLRKKLVTAIVGFSEDELNEQDYIRMAQESEEELLNRLINLLAWYFDEFNN